jgi:hypothetical protein
MINRFDAYPPFFECVCGGDRGKVRYGCIVHTVLCH